MYYITNGYCSDCKKFSKITCISQLLFIFATLKPKVAKYN